QLGDVTADVPHSRDLRLEHGRVGVGASMLGRAQRAVPAGDTHTPLALEHGHDPAEERPPATRSARADRAAPPPRRGTCAPATTAPCAGSARPDRLAADPRTTPTGTGPPAP